MAPNERSFKPSSRNEGGASSHKEVPRRRALIRGVRNTFEPSVTALEPPEARLILFSFHGGLPFFENSLHACLIPQEIFSDDGVSRKKSQNPLQASRKVRKLR